MAQTHLLGYPRIGPRREWKFALESFWRGEQTPDQLLATAAALRAQRWQVQASAGLSHLTAGDFAFYDPMLSQAAMLGALPRRFGFDATQLTPAQHFELARGNARQPAMEMTKWFDTNYHYLVPELDAHTRFEPGESTFFDDVSQAHAWVDALPAGSPRPHVKPVLIGPVSWLYLSKSHDPSFDRLKLLPALLEAFSGVLARLGMQGVDWVQLDEPILGLDLPAPWVAAVQQACTALANSPHPRPRLMLTTYFESVAEHASWINRLPIEGLHIDLVRAPGQLVDWLAALPAHLHLSVGIIDGRNVWRTDLSAVLQTLEPLHAQRGERLWLAPSCSLAHVPLSLREESSLDAELRPWLAFADEKLAELQILGRALNEGREAVADALQQADAAVRARRSSARVHNPWVQQRLRGVTAPMAQRQSPFAQRIAAQRQRLQLPPLPTTTIGSFPQTPAIRQARAAYKRGELSALAYLQRMRQDVEAMIRQQVDWGLDVLVHGEPERNDMVEYFGEQLWGFAFTHNGWVQSYGSRCVKPPILYGDVHRPEPMTVGMARYAQSLTDKPVKGMLTGPVTMLQWSFVRDDQPRALTARQLALALRDEVADLEQAGIGVIQIDEPAFREGLPLRRRDWPDYLDWAVNAFKLSACAVRDDTQIHTHMCYSEFNDILPAIAALDADVITIETSRSAMALLDGFAEFDYPNEIGPGVYDIHSPRIPCVQSMVTLLERACQVIPAERLWVNPDCGLKTRGWSETESALLNMVAAARTMRERLTPAQQAAQEAAHTP